MKTAYKDYLIGRKKEIKIVEVECINSHLEDFDL